MSDLTDDQAQAMLDTLTEHYRQPVLPMSSYCDAFRTWFQCIRENPHEHGSDYKDLLWQIQTDIEKSSLLDRMLYGGEGLRTRKCPEHDGKWSGIDVCEHGCGSTGWIPNGWPEEAPRCDKHPDEPSVARTTNVKDGTRHLCWTCYREAWS